MLDTDIVYHELKYMKLAEYKNAQFCNFGWVRATGATTPIMKSFFNFPPLFLFAILSVYFYFVLYEV